MTFKRPGMTYARTFYKTQGDKKTSKGDEKPMIMSEKVQEYVKLKERDPVVANDIKT